MSSPREKLWSDFRVGLIVFAGLALLVTAVILAGGDKGLFFQETAAVRARLADVGGLKKGASVTMGGMTIGRVTGIGFVEDNPHTQIEVAMEVRFDLRRRIKVDSLPAVRTQGMLGDRYVDISIGSEDAPSLPPGMALYGEAASDFDKTLRQATEVLKEMEAFLVAINERRGTAGQLVYDEDLYHTLTELTTELRDLVQDFKKDPRKYVKFSLF